MRSDKSSYGSFEGGGRRYVLKTTEPPRRWHNAHFSGPQDDEYLSECTYAGTGEVRCRDADGNICSLTDGDRKVIYLRDEDTGACWNIGKYPLNTKVTRFRCQYTAADTKLSSTFRGLAASQRVFVPRGATNEYWTLTLANRSKRLRRISVFAYAEFNLRGFGARGYYRSALYHETIFRPEVNGIWARNRNVAAPNPRYQGFLIGSQKPDHYACSREAFYGPNGSFASPRIVDGWDGDDKPCGDFMCCALLQNTLTLEPGQEIRIDYALGQCGSFEQIQTVAANLADPTKVDALLDQLEATEEQIAEGFGVDTGDVRTDAIMNFWIKKQLLSYLMFKNGFRDNLQADYALCMADYATAEQNLLATLAGQWPDGHGPHHYRPIKREIFCSDNPAWILMMVPGLIKESGDYSLLDKQVPFLQSNETGTVWEHMLRAMRVLTGELGPNGLCVMRDVDWNDSFQGTDDTPARESVMITQLLCAGLLELEALSTRIGADDIVAEARAGYETFKARLNDLCWDGRWYIRALAADGRRLGSSEEKEGKIFLNTQTWAVLSKTASPERARASFAAVDEMLDHELGTLTCFPAYSKWDPTVGQLSTTTPGSGTNGGCYQHAGAFKIVADCMLGRGEQAWGSVQKILPGSDTNPLAQSGCAPFAITNSATVNPTSYGQMATIWRTGTSAWIAVAVLEWILGVRRDYDGLLIDPCLPSHMSKARVRWRFRGAIYDIRIDNTAGRNRGVTRTTVDGKKIPGRHLPVFADGQVHNVRIVI